MKINKTYRSLLDKSINSMLSAIEIYNKPNFSYREETFAILAVNSWELLFKAILLKQNKYKLRSLYKLTYKKKQNGQDSKVKTPTLNRAGNPKTITINETIIRLEKDKYPINEILKKSIFSLIELRDNSIHFYNEKEISKEMQELGFACIKNYMNFIKRNHIEIDLSNYNFYLMPLAYIDSKIDANAILTEEVSNYMSFVKNQVASSSIDENYDIAISIDVNFKKSNSFDGFSMKFDKNGIPITMSEENIRNNFPLEYKDITTKARLRYVNFKMGKPFNTLMQSIKGDSKLHYRRMLNPNSTSKKPMGKSFYSTNIWQVLDSQFQKK
ncbi:DUF3644 domain-containing protein [Lutibacter sp.]|uniref:DUF3644 domain-containing protein n=1 Tax=Lutibacter sp. TaxID=1925666 RepID=UPI00356B5156